MVTPHSKYQSQVTERKATGLNCHHSQICLKGVAIHWDRSPVSVSFCPFSGTHGNGRISIDQEGQRDGEEHVDAVMQLASSKSAWFLMFFWEVERTPTYVCIKCSSSNPWTKGNEHCAATTQHRDNMTETLSSRPCLQWPCWSMQSENICFANQWIQFRERLQKTMKRVGAQYTSPAHVPYPFLGIPITQQFDHYRPVLLPMQHQQSELHKGSNQSTQVLRSAARVWLHRFVRTPEKSVRTWSQHGSCSKWELLKMGDPKSPWGSITHSHWYKLPK